MKMKRTYVSPVAEVHQLEQVSRVISTSGDGPSAAWMSNPWISNSPERRGVEYY